MNNRFLLTVAALCFMSIGLSTPVGAWTVASNNIPLDSQVYEWLDKLAGYGLIKSDVKGIRPFTRTEAARLLLEAEENRSANPDLVVSSLVSHLLRETRRALAREVAIYKGENTASGFDYKLFSSARARFVFVDGVPLSYDRPVHDPGNDGVFGIGQGLRPKNPYPSPTQQHGYEGTPLLENNEGVIFRRGSNGELRFTNEFYAGRWAAALVEPMMLYAEGDRIYQARINKGYLKLGSDSVELEVGRDANWLGLGYRGNITLTNNARNFDQIKLSSPEPIQLPWLGALKYSLIFARLDEVASSRGIRQPYFLASKVSVKPADFVEVGLNLGRQVGGPGVDNSFGSLLRGFVGGTNNDNSNSLAGLELRFRVPCLRNSEVYGEFSGEDAASFWPIVESYVAGFYIPRLTADGKNDLRFEYFFGNAALYTNGTFTQGYIYHDQPIGHSQGGAAQEFFFRYSHWFTARNNLALEYWHGERGNLGRVPVNGVMQTVERKDSARATWTFPLARDFDCGLRYGVERVRNKDLVGGQDRTNQLVSLQLSYKYR
ncbi:MAG: capsule assembly Wzi family protein [Deltaproteobacteria bacterium]|nr:capsule assembly Wzi family protein [Deltaproteobacteria bacterium]TLN03018.1 MAG: capsule assembly Wzi family protein [bacterium]